MPNRKERPIIAVVVGGPSAEAEISRISGRGVADALSAGYTRVITLEMSSEIGEELKRAAVDVVFPVMHGKVGEDGTFQGFLEILGLPYVGSGVFASACAMDKICAKLHFRALGLPVARDIIVQRGEGALPASRRALAVLGPSVVVKPARQGSAIGVSFAESPKEMEAALAHAFTYDDRILVEERIHGREITVPILERQGIEALPAVEVRTPAGSWYDYQHRYTAGYSEHIIPAPLPDAQYQRTLTLAQHAFVALGCRDLARVDFVVPEQGMPVLLEVNTLPGMTPTSLYPDCSAQHRAVL